MLLCSSTRLCSGSRTTLSRIPLRSPISSWSLVMKPSMVPRPDSPRKSTFMPLRPSSPWSVSTSETTCTSPSSSSLMPPSIVPTFGNHDTYPEGHMMNYPNNTWMTYPMAEFWDEWVPKDQIDNVKKGGYYTKLVRSSPPASSLGWWQVQSHRFELPLGVHHQQGGWRHPRSCWPSIRLRTPTDMNSTLSWRTLLLWPLRMVRRSGSSLTSPLVPPSSTSTTSSTPTSFPSTVILSWLPSLVTPTLMRYTHSCLVYCLVLRHPWY